MDKLEGMWSRGDRVYQRADQVAGGRFPRLGAAVMSECDNRVITLMQSVPGQHSVFYFTDKNGRLFWGENHDKLRTLARALCVRSKMRVLDAGETVTFDGANIHQEFSPIPVPTPREGISLDDAVDILWQAFVAATREIYDFHGGGPVLLAASGGTDSMLVARALHEIGADVLAVSTGHSLDNFDPKWAKTICNYWGVPFELVQIPTDTDALIRLQEDTLRIVGDVGCAANVRMAMSCTLMQRRGSALGRRIVYTGYHADILVGNKPQVVGAFRKLPPDAQTSRRWAEMRANFANGMIPNTHQLHASFSVDGFEWRAPFGHPDVISAVLSMPLSVSPVQYGHKTLFEATLNRFLPKGKRPWDEKRKIAFNEGSGLQATSHTVPELTDAGIRAMLRRVRPSA